MSESLGETTPEALDDIQSNESPPVERGKALEAVEVLEEKPEEIERIIEEEMAGIEKALEKDSPAQEGEISQEQRAKQIKEYQDKYLPSHLRDKPGIASRMVRGIAERLSSHNTEGRENVPEEGPFLVVANHFGDEGTALLKEFRDNNIHVSLGRQIWWERSAAHRWLFKKIGTLPVQESLANLSQEEKEQSRELQDGYGKKVFSKIIDREKQGVSIDKEFIRSAVAALSRGDAVSIFPEGLWLNPEGSMLKPRERAQMKKAYRGMELIAREYKKLTGEELPILPVAFDENKESGEKTLRIGESLALSENESELSDTDYVMTHIASMLPEEQRGHYKESVESLQD